MTYPWKLIARLVAIQTITLGIVIFGVHAILPAGSITTSLIVVFLITSYLLFRWFIRPLARIINLFKSETDDSDDESDTPFEWADLDILISKLRDKENIQADDLVQERDELSLLMASISDAIVAIDLDEKFLFLNSKFILLFGQSKVVPQTLKLAEVIRDPSVLESFRSSIKNIRQQQVSVTLTTNTDSGDRDFSLSITPLLRRDGSIYGSVGIFHDVTELKKAEKVRIEFVANVSHELRTPLTSIKGYTETLAIDLQDSLKPETKKFFGIIQQNVQRLMALIDDLLDLSSLESNQQFFKESISTSRVTQRITEQLDSKIKTKGQIIHTEFSSDTVYADEKRVEQVLTNLIDNAHKYSPANSKIELTWQALSGGVELQVRDFGPGIPSDSLPRLFERFYRVDKGRSREMGGTGLGLAIVKHILLQHSGRAWAESQIGQGSTFKCFFPNEG